MDKSIEKLLKERLLIDENQNINTKFDELASTVRMLVKKKCKEQRLNCALNVELNYDEYDCLVVLGVKHESIINAKEPEL